ncbi:hypothetical protein [uncultured Pseudomonas sp.]|uniref:hypothetical protein n=1 Tax=uncultured Pseudomonas sp. TaxID=114707 RepID=UPI00258C6BD2|nr:hypothetical protein [uncultured Pseudomonas sp.]
MKGEYQRALEFQAFMRRYFPTFITAYFLSIYALAGTFSLFWKTYCRTCSMATTYPLSFGLLIMFLFVAHAAVMRGRNWGAWWVAVIYIGSMLVALSTYGRRPHLFILTTTLLAGLLGLLVLNSQRYREMRLRLAEYREQRRLGRTRR